jgi:serine protease
VEQDSWQYEGIAFQALLPVVGACPAGTDPVWRLYNNRFAEMDSNHRFVASSETYRTMIADGWQGEGVAFCSPFAVGKDEA